MLEIVQSAAARSPRPVVGMVHLAPLPGSPRYGGDLGAIGKAALLDAAALVEGGADAIMMENYGDVPFHKSAVPSHTVAHMTSMAMGIRDRFGVIPLGINVLRNDGCAAIGIAHAVGASFIRVNVLSGARVTDQGVIEGIAADLLRLRSELGADVKIFADVNVKHSAALGDYRLVDEVADVIERGLADAVVVSGTGTGRSTPLDEVRTVADAAGETPVFIGSGASTETVADLASAGACGFIVGTSLKSDGVVDAAKVAALVAAVRSLD